MEIEAVKPAHPPETVPKHIPNIIPHLSRHGRRCVISFCCLGSLINSWTHSCLVDAGRIGMAVAVMQRLDRN